MAHKLLTLRISQTTDVAKAVQSLELLLADVGVANASLTQLLLDTAHRFKAELVQTATVNSETGAPAKMNSGKTLIRGEGYRILITTRPETSLSRLVDQLLRRPPAIT